VLLEPEKFWHYRRWAVKALAGHGYEVTSAEARAAYAPAKEAADQLGMGADFRARVRSIVNSYTHGEAFVGNVLRGQLADA
jgi:hypothetical protein